MIKYDYTIERKIGEGKTQRFTPESIPKELTNLVSIEGPNSSGKSTLLSIIALGLFGTKNTRIHPALQDKMQLLLSSDYQKLKFKIEIASENGDLVLRSEKKDFQSTEIIVQESIEGKPYRPLTFESFDRKYNLIYDIPSNPAERLYDLLKELKEEQLKYGNRLNEFGWYVRQVLTEVASHRDPKRLAEVTKGLMKVKKDKEKFAEELPHLRTFLDSLEKQVYAKQYSYYLNECITLREEKEKFEKESKKLDKGEREISGKLAKFRSDIAALQGDFSVAYNEVTPLIGNALPKKEAPRFKIWRKINPYGTESSDLRTIKTEAIHYESLFGSELEEMRSESSYKNAELLKKIIQALGDFENSSLVIPKIDVTLGDLIGILKDENKKNYLLMSKSENLTTIINLLGKLRASIGLFEQKLEERAQIASKSEELSEDYSKSYYEQKDHLKMLNESLRTAQGKCDFYLQKCLSKGINKKDLEGLSYFELVQTLPRSEELKPFLSLTEKQIEEKIAELEYEISEKSSKLKSCDIYIEQYQKEKDRLDKQKPHKYEKYRDQLEFLLKKTEAISQKLLTEYDNNMKLLIARKVDKNRIEGEAKKRYYEEVSKYLASQLGSFRHIDAVHKAKTVDLISGIIITDKNITIHIADMGTGQSQSAYITSLLNAKNDNRRIVALFDEIAMMDDNSLMPIYEKMRRLYSGKKLIVGIMVQKGNVTNVTSLIQ